MWRLVVSIILLGVFLVFMASNANNKCDIRFLFDTWTISNVPVYLTVLGSFLLGMLCTIPIIISVNLKRRKERKILQNKEKKKIDDGAGEHDDVSDQS